MAGVGSHSLPAGAFVARLSAGAFRGARSCVVAAARRLLRSIVGAILALTLSLCARATGATGAAGAAVVLAGAGVDHDCKSECDQRLGDSWGRVGETEFAAPARAIYAAAVAWAPGDVGMTSVWGRHESITEPLIFATDQFIPLLNLLGGPKPLECARTRLPHLRFLYKSETKTKIVNSLERLQFHIGKRQARRSTIAPAHRLHFSPSEHWRRLRSTHVWPATARSGTTMATEGRSDMPIRIQLLSDLHLEIERQSPSPTGGDGGLYEYDFPAAAPILALLGDIGTTIEDRLFDWLRAQLARFELVFFLAGNHEPYWSTIEESQQRLAAFAAECNSDPSPGCGRFVLLDRTRYDLSPTLTVLGCTLWAELDPAELDILRWSVTDFKRIAHFDPAASQARHRADLAWLRQAVADIAEDDPERKRRIVVMTHHAPTVEGASDPKWAGGPTGSAFATELLAGERSEDWRGRVKVWMFGHTHSSCDFVREGVRVVSNQRGYRDGDEGFAPDKMVEI